MTPAASSGSISYTLQTFDAISNLVITDVVSGITTSDSEKGIAKKVLDQINTTICMIGASYNGTPVLVGESASAQFQLTRSDHVVCIFSQSQFQLDITDDTTGAIYSVRSSPALTTVADVQKYSTILNQSFSNLTNAQIANLIELVSDEIVEDCRTPIVLSTFVTHVVTNLYDGYQLPIYPVYDMDNPSINRPWTILNFVDVSVSDVTTRYHIQRDGWIVYKYPQNLVYVTNDPYEKGNMWMVSWVAGHSQIPEIVKRAVAKITPFYTSFSMYEELSGGTSRVKFKDEYDEKLKILKTLTNYKV